jgi:hypothetical protein
VNHLSKTVYEGCRRGGGGEGEWRLPAEVVTVFKATRGYQQLVAMRNFWDHDPWRGTRLDEASRNFKNEGDVYQQHCGSRSPTAVSDWCRIRDGIVSDLVRALEDVSSAVKQITTP